MKTNEYTVIIPTYNNRYKYLNRILDYLSSYKLNILVVDSSLDPFPDRGNYDIEYLHLPKYSYTMKLYLALKKVVTPFALMCADDDFVIPSSIDKCVSFLNANDDYASVQGNIIAFKNKIFIPSFPWMINTYALDINKHLPTERIHEFFNHHMYLHYSVHRKDNLIATFELMKNFENEFVTSVIEYALDIVAIINGKHKVFPVFYYVSELTEVSSRNSITPISEIRLTKEFRQMITALGTYLSLNSIVKKKESIDFIDNVFKNSWYFSKGKTDKDVGSYPLSDFKIIKKYIDKLIISNYFKQLYSKLFYQRKKRKFERELRGQIKATRRLRGYPYFEEESKREWRKVRSIIKKHRRF